MAGWSNKTNFVLGSSHDEGFESQSRKGKLLFLRIVKFLFIRKIVDSLYSKGIKLFSWVIHSKQQMYSW
jgi:hypothetical protein